MGRPLLASAALLVSCTCSEPDVAVQPPIDAGPAFLPWSGPANVDGPGHLRDGAVKLTARLSAIPDALRPESLRTIDPQQPVTATIGGPAHLRVAWTQLPGTSWRTVLPTGTPCTAFDDAQCLQSPDGLAGVVEYDDRVRVDLVASEAAAGAQQLFERPVGPGPHLRGDVVASWSDVHALQGHPQPAAIAGGDLAFTDGETRRFRIRWALEHAPPAEHSRAAAPSWAALCDGARACARTGPWPDLDAWLARYPAVTLSASDLPSALAALASQWPHILAAWVADRRADVPAGARGFFDQALSGLGHVEFAGARLDDDGSGIAFVRVPAPWVNFAASALSYAGYPSAPHALGDGTEVSWAAMPTGGVVMALDEGPEPSMGWLAFASAPERYAWLQRLPKTQAGPSSAQLHVARLSDVLTSTPPAVRQALADHGASGLTVQVAGDAGFLVATAELGPKVR